MHFRFALRQISFLENGNTARRSLVLRARQCGEEEVLVLDVTSDSAQTTLHCGDSSLKTFVSIFKIVNISEKSPLVFLSDCGVSFETSPLENRLFVAHSTDTNALPVRITPNKLSREWQHRPSQPRPPSKTMRGRGSACFGRHFRLSTNDTPLRRFLP
ncbi:hypothetical protein CEXT_207721 [Caerostris extrusa]|uniref:Uncharacterized protein n=1 Tax=Caerostris extrusa TaxID=172846 RepID=A0AAV4Q2T1_CAEEX|nr:hypothetical protein CEXT_207721 [Caerostris extrusa]